MKRHYFLASIVLTVAVLAVSLGLYPQLPNRIPTHWNLQGKVDDYSGRGTIFLMPGILLLMVGLFRILPWLSPKQFSVDSFRNTYEFVMFLVIVLLAYDHVLMLWAALSGSLDINRSLLGGLFLFLAMLGNVLGRVRRNFWIGVRTPWTLASERVWNDTHRVAGKLFVLAGILGFAATMAGASPIVAIVLICAAAIIAVTYSLVDYKRLERRGQV